MPTKISELPAGTANPLAVVPATNAAGTVTQKITLGDIASLSDETIGTSSEITEDKNNYALPDVDIVRISATSGRSITGFSGGTAATAKLLVNVGPNDIALKHLSASSLSANRISVPWAGDYLLAANGGAALIVYDGVSSLWRVITGDDKEPPSFVDAPTDGGTYARSDGQWIDIEQAANLQLRRGTAAEVAAITPLPAEPVWTTDTKLLYVGDGSTLGGVLVGDSFIRTTTSVGPLSGTYTLDSALSRTLATTGSVWYVEMLSMYSLPSPFSDAPQVRLPMTGLTLIGNGSSQNPAGTISAFNPATGSNVATLSSSSTPGDSWSVRWSGLATLTASSVTLGLEHAGGGGVVRSRGYLSVRRVA